MKRKEGKFTGANGLELFYERSLPDIDAVAVVAVVHGFGEHGGRYNYLVSHLVSRGFAMYTFDQRGHGRSPGARGYLSHWSEYRDDVAAYLKLIGEQMPGQPVFLFGHSLGGLVAAEYALHYPAGLKGLVLSSPLLAQANLPATLLMLSRVLSVIYPSFSINTKLDVNTISRDPVEVKRYADDPLVHSTGTARLGTEVTATMAWVHAHAAELKLPLLLYYGTNDQLVPPAGSRRFFDALTLADKERIEYPGGHHESHNDTHRAQVFTDVERWLEKHLA
jgi:alpha-beta hydrolase superfamily lysophospholipase